MGGGGVCDHAGMPSGSLHAPFLVKSEEMAAHMSQSGGYRQ